MNSCKVCNSKTQVASHSISQRLRLTALESVTLVGSKALMEHLYAKDHSFKNKPCIE